MPGSLRRRPRSACAERAAARVWRCRCRTPRRARGATILASILRRAAVNPRRITPGTLALVVAALLVLAVGLYTANGGFQLAGALILLVGIFLAITQASGRGG